MATQVKLLRNLTLIVAAALVITLAPALSVIGEEVITLTTIMPSQDTLRVKRGAVGVNYKETATLSNAQIGDDNLLIEGKVGIGTTSPSENLEVSDVMTGSAGSYTDWPEVRITSETDSVYNIGDIHGRLSFYTEDAGGNFPAITSAIDAITTRVNGQSYGDTGLSFKTGSSDAVLTERMVITHAGNVGIGTTSPTTPAPGPGGTPTTGNLDVNDVYLRSTGGWLSAGGITSYAVYHDQKPPATDAGDFVAGSVVLRTLNTTVVEVGSDITRSGSTITLNAGTYRISASVPAYRVKSHKAVLERMVPTIETVLYGTSEFSGSSYNVSTRSLIDGIISVAQDGSQYKILHTCESTKLVDGMGKSDLFGGQPSDYTQIRIEKIS